MPFENLEKEQPSIGCSFFFGRKLLSGNLNFFLRKWTYFTAVNVVIYSQGETYKLHRNITIVAKRTARSIVQHRKERVI